MSGIEQNLDDPKVNVKEYFKNFIKNKDYFFNKIILK